MKTTIQKALFAIAILVALPAYAQQKITVHNAQELLEAIGPDRIITIDAKQPLNITEAIDYYRKAGIIRRASTYFLHGEEVPYTYEEDLEDLEGGISDDPDNNSSATHYTDEELTFLGLQQFRPENLKPTKFKPITRTKQFEHLYYECNFDGRGLEVRNCPNLTIRSKKGSVALLAKPRYVNVIDFIKCDNLTLENLVMGHTIGGYCDNGVLQLTCCNKVRINDCDLFGCGTEGFIIRFCNDVIVNRSSVHDCTYHTMHVGISNDVRFNDCRFYRNQEYSQINIGGCNGVVFTSCVFDELKGELFNFDDNHIIFGNCTFRNCEIEPIIGPFYSNGEAIMHHCTTIFGDAPLPEIVKDKPDYALGSWTDGQTEYTATLIDEYKMLLTNKEGEAFAIQCFDKRNNDYETCSVYGLHNPLGILTAEYIITDSKHFIRVYDDGHELMKSFFYLGK